MHSPFQINDWGIKKFLKLVLAVQFAMWGVIGLEAIGFQILIIRQLVGFIYLTLVPGLIILRILELHRLNIIESILYSVGLSIAFLMFIGLFMNTLYPHLGISRPISLFPLIITLTIAVTVLWILAYKRDKGFSSSIYIDMKNLLSPPTLFLILLPFLTIFGTYLVNFYHNNILLMLLIIVIAAVALLIGFNRFIPKNLYPLAVFIIAISLLYHRSLISMYIWGWDIHIEYYLSNLVIINSHWNPSIPRALNAMLSITQLAPVYSNICSMSLTWVFKIVYPLLFSLVPLGLYRVFQRQTNNKIAFLACFFFMSIGTFFSAMLTLMKQEIAEFFFVLLILLMIDKDMDKTKRAVLFIVFGVSLAVSHYGTSYIYMFCLICAWLILVLGKNLEIQKLMSNLYSKFGKKREKSIENSVSLKVDRTISLIFVLLFITFTLAWYMYVSSFSAFNTIIRIGDHVASSIWRDFLNPEAAEGLRLIMTETVSPLHSILKYLHLITQFFITIGVVTLLLKRKEIKFEREYKAFSLINFGICFGGITLPYFASSLATERLYHITLFFLAPFCVIGGITIFKMMGRVVRTSWTDQRVRSSLMVLSVFFAIFLLFNSGLVYEIAKDNPCSISLNSTIDYPRFNYREVLGAEWLYDVKSGNPVYADEYRRLLLGSFEWGQVRTFLVDADRIREDSYIYLGSLSIEKKEIMVIDVETARRITREYINSSQIVDDRNKIYNNGGAQVYY